MFQNHYAQAYDLLNQNKPYQKEIEFVYEWAGRPQSILDLGCGTASYWKYFPLGTRVNGIERSSGMIRARPYFEANGTILKGDIVRYEYSLFEPFDCVTALFDVMNYVSDISWIDQLPLKKGKFFIFDVLDNKKEKFTRTERELGDLKRVITPVRQDTNKVTLHVSLEGNGTHYSEDHELYLWKQKDIEKATAFEIVEVKQTETWQTWYKLRKK